MDDEAVARVREEYAAIHPKPNEKERRLWAARKAKALGRGGILLVAGAIGITRQTISKAIHELEQTDEQPDADPLRVRKPGGGRKRVTTVLVPKLDALIEPLGADAARSPLRWTCKSAKQLAEMLSQMAEAVKEGGAGIKQRTLAKLLQEQGYNLMNHRGREGTTYQDRDEQCRHICDCVRDFLTTKEPALFVDVQRNPTAGAGDRGAGGKMELDQLKETDLQDLAKHSDWSSMGIDRDTAEFAGQGIGAWWREIGRDRFKKALKILVVADGGGNNRQRTRAWQAALEGVADDVKLQITASHFPPTTYKWRALENCLHYITSATDGDVAVLYQTIVGRIGQHAGDEPLRVVCESGQKHTASRSRRAPIAELAIERQEVRGAWNDAIIPLH